MAKQLDEMATLKKVNDLLGALDEEARARVLGYTNAKWRKRADGLDGLLTAVGLTRQDLLAPSGGTMLGQSVTAGDQVTVAAGFAGQSDAAKKEARRG